MTSKPPTISVSDADDLVRRLTGDRMSVRSDGRHVMLCHIGKRLSVNLLPYQLTRLEIERVVAENEPWPE